MTVCAAMMMLLCLDGSTMRRKQSICDSSNQNENIKINHTNRKKEISKISLLHTQAQCIYSPPLLYAM